jgi:hypothetical protein
VRAQVLASSRIAGARAIGIMASLSWTRRLRSLQIDQATNQTKASKPLRRVLATDFLVEHHQAARDMGQYGRAGVEEYVRGFGTTSRD